MSPLRRTSPARRRARLALVASSLAIGALASQPALAQYTITPVQPLAFGYLTQGLTEVVPYTDTFRRGLVTVDGTGQAWIRLSLPTTLTSPQGASIPLQFLTGDVASQEAGKPPSAFDPTGSTRVNLSKGTASLFIGGRALPAANQRAGLYSATMVVIISSTAF